MTSFWFFVTDGLEGGWVGGKMEGGWGWRVVSHRVCRSHQHWVPANNSETTELVLVTDYYCCSQDGHTIVSFKIKTHVSHHLLNYLPILVHAFFEPWLLKISRSGAQTPCLALHRLGVNKARYEASYLPIHKWSTGDPHFHTEYVVSVEGRMSQ